MNRRSFFQRTVGVMVAAVAARYVPKARLVRVGTINRATYEYWKAQPLNGRTVMAFDALGMEMRRLYQECKS